MTALLTETQRENQDSRLIPLSSLQHYAFCPRQCALIHNEQAWAENYLTAQGKALHERVDSGEPETRKGVRFERTVHVSAEKLGISGVLDLVEVETKTGRLKPVEYKRGKPKPDLMDELQLCAQGLCLEEMTEQTVSEGTLWYMQTRHRVLVVFSDNLRAQTLATIVGVRAQYSVFECDVTPDQWVILKNKLLETYDPTCDSLRFYHLGSKWRNKVEHHGTKPAIDVFKDVLVI